MQRKILRRESPLVCTSHTINRNPTVQNLTAAMSSDHSNASSSAFALPTFHALFPYSSYVRVPIRGGYKGGLLDDKSHASRGTKPVCVGTKQGVPGTEVTKRFQERGRGTLLLRSSQEGHTQRHVDWFREPCINPPSFCVQDHFRIVATATKGAKSSSDTSSNARSYRADSFLSKLCIALGQLKYPACLPYKNPAFSRISRQVPPAICCPILPPPPNAHLSPFPMASELPEGNNCAVVAIKKYTFGL